MAKGVTANPQDTKEKAPKQGVTFIYKTVKQAVVALPVLRLLSDRLQSELLATIAAIFLGLFLRHAATRFLLPNKVRQLWEPLRMIRKSRKLLLQTALLIDAVNYMALHFPRALRFAVGKAGWTPVEVFLLQYLFESTLLTGLKVASLFFPLLHQVPLALLGYALLQPQRTQHAQQEGTAGGAQPSTSSAAAVVKKVLTLMDRVVTRMAGVMREEMSAFQSGEYGKEEECASDVQVASLKHRIAELQQQLEVLQQEVEE